MTSKFAMQLMADLFQNAETADAEGRIIDLALDDLYDRLAAWMSNQCLLYAGHGPSSHEDTCRKALAKFREYLEEYPTTYPMDGPPKWALRASQQLSYRRWEGHLAECLCANCESSRAQLIASCAAD